MTSFYLSIGRNQEFLNSCSLVPAETPNSVVQVIVARTYLSLCTKYKPLFHPYPLPSQIYGYIYIYLSIMHSQDIFRCHLKKKRNNKWKLLYKSTCKFFFLILRKCSFLVERHKAGEYKTTFFLWASVRGIWNLR